MKTYLESKKLYVKNESNLIYETEYISTYDGYDWFEIKLVLVCGYDYISPDNNIQGYVKAERFTDEVQTERIVCYF